MKFSKYVVLAVLAGFVAQPAVAASDKQEPGQGGPAMPADPGQGGVGVYIPADNYPHGRMIAEFPTDEDKWNVYIPADHFH